MCSQAAQGAVRLEGDVITAHGSVSSLPMATIASTGGRGGMRSSSPADNASVCTCTCTRPRSRNDGYRAGTSPPYASGSIYDGGGFGGGGGDDCGGGDDSGEGEDCDDDGDDGGCDVQDIQLETFYDAYTPSSVDPYNCRQRVVQTQHRSSI